MNWSTLLSTERRKTARYSFLEIFTIWCFSNVPVAILLFVKMATATGDELRVSALKETVARQIEPAEVFVYLCVILAPIVWMMVVHWRARTHYRLFVFLLSVQVIILALTGIVYALYKTGAGLNDPFVEFFASGSYTLVILIWFSTVYFRRAILETLAPGSPAESGSGLAEKLKERDHAK